MKLDLGEPVTFPVVRSGPSQRHSSDLRRALWDSFRRSVASLQRVDEALRTNILGRRLRLHTWPLGIDLYLIPRPSPNIAPVLREQLLENLVTRVYRSAYAL